MLLREIVTRAKEIYDGFSDAEPGKSAADRQVDQLAQENGLTFEQVELALEEAQGMVDKMPASIPPDSGGVTPQGAHSPEGEKVGNEYIGDKQPPEQPTGSVGAPGAAGDGEVSVDERGRK